MSEAECINQAQQGNSDAFEDLVRMHQTVAFRTAFVILRNAEEAEDATQAAFVKAWLHLERFRSGAPFRPWLLRIVANEAKNHQLANRRRANRQLPEDLSYLIPSPDAEPDQHLLAGEKSAWLLGHIERLRDDDRLVITCRYLLMLSEIESAAVLGCQRGTVKSRLHRAVGRLREAIARDPAKEIVS